MSGERTRKKNWLFSWKEIGEINKTETKTDFHREFNRPPLPSSIPHSRAPTSARNFVVPRRRDESRIRETFGKQSSSFWLAAVEWCNVQVLAYKLHNEHSSGELLFDTTNNTRIIMMGRKNKKKIHRKIEKKREKERNPKKGGKKSS